MKVITIGRGNENNDIVVNDPKVSRHHLQLVMDDQGIVSAVDLSSTNGIFVNGQHVTGKVFLKKTDELRIGDTVLPWQGYFGTPSNTGILTPERPQTPPPHTSRTSSTPTVSYAPVTSQEPVLNPSPKHWLIYVIISAVVLMSVGGFLGWRAYRNNQQINKELELKEAIEIAENEASQTRDKLDRAVLEAKKNPSSRSDQTISNLERQLEEKNKTITTLKQELEKSKNNKDYNETPSNQSGTNSEKKTTTPNNNPKPTNTYTPSNKQTPEATGSNEGGRYDPTAPDRR